MKRTGDFTMDYFNECVEYKMKIFKFSKEISQKVTLCSLIRRIATDLRTFKKSYLLDCAGKYGDEHIISICDTIRDCHNLRLDFDKFWRVTENQSNSIYNFLIEKIGMKQILKECSIS